MTHCSNTNRTISAAPQGPSSEPPLHGAAAVAAGGRRRAPGDLDLIRSDQVVRGLRALADQIVVDVARAAADLDDALGVVVVEAVAVDVVLAGRDDQDARREAERAVGLLLELGALLHEPIGI